MEESASNLINFYTNRIEELKTQLTKSNNKIEKIKEYIYKHTDWEIDGFELLSIIDGSDE